MSTQSTRTFAKSFGVNIESDLAMEFIRVVENAAIASAKTMGFGDRKHADEVATEAMRHTMDTVPMKGTIVIGEGERDEAPMLYIGEKVGAEFPDGTHVPEDRHRGRSARRHEPVRHRRSRSDHGSCRKRTRRTAARSRLLHGKNRRRPLVQGLRRYRRSGGPTTLSRSHARSIVRSKILWSSCLTALAMKNSSTTFARPALAFSLIGDGDLSAGIAAAVLGTGVHAVMGTGGAPEGVITAAALRCLNGYMQGRLTGYTPEQKERMNKWASRT